MAHAFTPPHLGYPPPVTPPPHSSREQLYQFLEDRFACAQSCSDCARACAVRASLVGSYGTAGQERARRLGIMCAEVCDTTCRALSEEGRADGEGTEDEIRLQLEWCRSLCVEAAEAFDGQPGAENAANACRTCAQACTDFMAALAA